MKTVDRKIIILLGIIGAGAVALVVAFAVQMYMGSAALRFGDPASWRLVHSSLNNMSFRVPDGFDVIVPVDAEATPFSIVKKGERGGSMLIQFGTLRRDNVYEDTADGIADYEGRFAASRKTEKRIERDLDGRKAVTLIQRESTGRLVGETFIFDPAIVNVASLLADSPKGEMREVSLQLPNTATRAEANLYEDLYVSIVDSIQFLQEPLIEDEEEAANGFPLTGWSLFEDADAGFEMRLPPDWEFAERVEELGLVEYRFRTRSEEVNNSEATFSVRALPGVSSQKPTSGFLATAYVQPFKDAALVDSLMQETVVMPGVGDATSLEARREKEGFPDLDELAALLVIVGGEETPQPGRGYVQESVLPDGKGQDMRFDQIRAITRSFALIPSDLLQFISQ